MTGNLTLRRIVMLVLMSVLLFAFFTLGIYSAVSPRIFAQAKQQELYPRAEFLAGQAAAYFQSGENNPYMQFFSVDSRQWGATVYLVDQERNVIANTDQGVTHSEYSLSIADFEALLQTVLSGEEVTHLSYVLRPKDNSTKATEVLFIGLPVIVEGEVRGAVIMLKPLEEIISAMSTLSSALWFSAFAVLAAMMPMVYWFSRRITYPLKQMRDVALRMAAGDFEVRANAQEPGEIGDMARALNHLSSELGTSIDALTRERNEAVTIVNALSEGVLSVNTEGLPMMSNPALQTMMISAGHGRMLSIPREVWEEFQIALKERRGTESGLVVGDLRLRLTVTPIIDPNTGKISAVGVFHDETQSYRLEQTRREYVANVSHELRTPLTALRAMIEPLRDGLIRTEEKRQETYSIILRETMRLARLVDDMLELSRLQSGKLALEKVRFEVSPLIHDVASTYAAKAADTGHVLQLDLGSDPDAIPSVMGNPDRTEQVLIAFLNNAFTYTPPGSSIVLRVEAKEDYVLVTVEDNGPGINPDDLPHVFDRFYKADKSHGGTTGTGLGLAISRELMDRLGEEIHAENRPEGGARFSFTVHYR